MLLLLLAPAPRECGDPIIRAGETQRAQVSVYLLERSALLTRSFRFRVQPISELRGESIELARTLAFGITRQHSAGTDIAPDRVSRYAEAFGDLAQLDMIAIVPASNDAQYCHVDHSVLPLVAERASVFYVGQYSMQITASGGSDLGANQHVVNWADLYAAPVLLFQHRSCRSRRAFRRT